MRYAAEIGSGCFRSLPETFGAGNTEREVCLSLKLNLLRRVIDSIACLSASFRDRWWLDYLLSGNGIRFRSVKYC